MEMYCINFYEIHSMHISKEGTFFLNFINLNTKFYSLFLILSSLSFHKDRTSQ